MKAKIFWLAVVFIAGSVNIFSQLSLPRESSGATVTQTVGDTKVTIVYHRPNVKGRTVWGKLVPYGEVWRTGANENTTIEISRDVTVNGQNLPAGKYGFHAIPNENEWTLIFSKVNDAWGSFTYDEKQDALRVKVAPKKSKDNRESLNYEFESVTPRSTVVVLSWEKLRVPFTVDIGDIYGRNLTNIREAIKNRKPEDFRPLNQGANYVLTFKIKENYTEAVGWLDESLKAQETFGSLNIKARILAETGKNSEAAELGEKAVQIGKTSTPAANPAMISSLEEAIKEWKSKK